jgi:YggT family protein
MDLVCTLLRLYMFVVVIRIILGMVIEFGRIPDGHPVRRIGDLLGMAVDPVLAPIRRLIPGLPLGGMTLDLSPLVLIFGLLFLTSLLCSG